MSSIDKISYLSESEYKDAIFTLREFTVRALSCLDAKSPKDLKHCIIGNFIARGVVCLNSIYALWQLRSYQDCWILHRALIDRYVHLRFLIENDDFVEFERWSFQRQFQMTDVALSDPAIRHKMQPEALRKATLLHKEQRNRINQELKSSWTLLKPKQALKQFNLAIIYPLGYDVGSIKVHPTADDGKEEFAELLGLPLDTYADNWVILHNSLLVQFLLVQEGLSGCAVLWRGFVSDFLEHWFSFFESGSEEWLLKCQRVIRANPDISWCEPRTEEHTSHGEAKPEKTQ